MSNGLVAQPVVASNHEVNQAKDLEHLRDNRVAARVGVRAGNRPADAFLAESVRWTFRVKVLTKIETDLMGDARELAEGEAGNPSRAAVS